MAAIREDGFVVTRRSCTCLRTWQGSTQSSWQNSLLVFLESLLHHLHILQTWVLGQQRNLWFRAWCQYYQEWQIFSAKSDFFPILLQKLILAKMASKSENIMFYVNHFWICHHRHRRHPPSSLSTVRAATAVATVRAVATRFDWQWPPTPVRCKKYRYGGCSIVSKKQRSWFSTHSGCLILSKKQGWRKYTHGGCFILAKKQLLCAAISINQW